MPTSWDYKNEVFAEIVRDAANCICEYIKRNDGCFAQETLERLIMGAFRRNRAAVGLVVLDKNIEIGGG